MSGTDTQQLTVIASYANGATQDVTALADYVSDDGAVATVNGTGLITGVAVGNCIVTATYEGQNDTSAVEVTA